MRHDVASAQKSVVAVLMAVAFDQGLLTLDDPVSDHLGRGWSRAGPDHEAAVTIRHLMTMTSGLNDGLESEVAPGTRWRYSLGPAWHLIKQLLIAASQTTLERLTVEWLTGPLDMADTIWVERPGMAYLDGKPFEALFTTARDLVRFGRLVVDRGDHDGRRIVSEANLARLLRPSQDHNPAYGMLWWLNGQRPHLLPLIDRPVDDVMFPGAPDDAVAALGAMGQICLVVPSRSAVVARVGGATPGPLALIGGTMAVDIWPMIERTVLADGVGSSAPG